MHELAAARHERAAALRALPTPAERPAPLLAEPVPRSHPPEPVPPRTGPATRTGAPAHPSIERGASPSGVPAQGLRSTAGEASRMRKTDITVDLVT